MRNTPRLKLYGERNTGTNYLSRLLQTNLDVALLGGTAPHALQHLRRYFSDDERLIDAYFRWSHPFNLGWKHAATSSHSQHPLNPARPTGFLFLVRNPYSWLLSLHKNPYHQSPIKNMGFEAFLDRPWQIHQRDAVAERPLNPIQLWNVKVRSYLDFSDQRKILVRFEDLLENPEHWVAQIAHQFDAKPTQQYFTNITPSTKTDGRRYDDYRDYYRHERWKEKLNTQLVERINRDLDQDLLTRLGYPRLSF